VPGNAWKRRSWSSSCQCITEGSAFSVPCCGSSAGLLASTLERRPPRSHRFRNRSFPGETILLSTRRA